MKCLIFNTEEIDFTTGKKSNRPLNIKSSLKNDDFLTYYDISVVFVCVEADDDKMDINTIFDELMRYHAQVGRLFLIVPFVHLTSFPMLDSRMANEYLNILTDQLKQKGVLSGRIGFGYHRGFTVSFWTTVFPHPGSVAFRDSKYLKIKDD